ncbi:MAG: patatin-like phospholipase family protein [Desulfuromonadaceae bacterium]|nr:patatin-like phospholipase family protein [Desulfuromonadaceae bacterium]
MPPVTSKTALILAGGGIMGAAYEIGSLTALDRLFSPGFSTRRFGTYIGVSAGSVIAALIANRIAPAELFYAISNDEHTVFNWNRRDIYRFELTGLATSCMNVLRNGVKVFRHHRQRGWGFSLADLPTIIQEQFPAGIFSLAPMQHYLCSSFQKEGIVDNFARLQSKLLIPAYDLDLGERVVFGTGERQDMHICAAITASCSIPFFFRPWQIGTNYYQDGSYGQGGHLDLAVERGAKLIILINPRVPISNNRERVCLPSMSYGNCSSIANLGITFAWEQMQRVETQVKINLEVEALRRTRPDIDVIVMEPGGEEALLFFQSPMSQQARNHIMDYGYHLTLSQLSSRFDALEEIFTRHGISVRNDRLEAAPPTTRQTYR